MNGALLEPMLPYLCEVTTLQQHWACSSQQHSNKGFFYELKIFSFHVICRLDFTILKCEKKKSTFPSSQISVDFHDSGTKYNFMELH